MAKIFLRGMAKNFLGGMAGIFLGIRCHGSFVLADRSGVIGELYNSYVRTNVHAPSRF
jgi:hypothetical protein